MPENKRVLRGGLACSAQPIITRSMVSRCLLAERHVPVHPNNDLRVCLRQSTESGNGNLISVGSPFAIRRLDA
jgi:hypothetical protein